MKQIPLAHKNGYTLVKRVNVDQNGNLTNVIDYVVICPDGKILVFSNEKDATKKFEVLTNNLDNPDVHEHSGPSF